MKASMEYLLSGIPVVTTVNKGGRDYFLDGRFTIWVEDDPDSVLHAVSWFAEGSISPEFIRQETLRKLLQANEMFIQELSAAFSLNVNDLRSRLMQDDFNISRERPVDEL
jgi:glycosyltransferase involved in cell wall biosynthesis